MVSQIGAVGLLRVRATCGEGYLGQPVVKPVTGRKDGSKTMITRSDIVDICGPLLKSPAMRLALMCIIPYACVLVGLDVAAHYGDATGAALPVQFFMSQDGSFAEYLEYSMTIAAGTMMLLLWLRSRALVYLASVILFAWMTLDNWIEIHEQLGYIIGAILPPENWLPVHPNHIAETLVFLVVGGVWALGILTAILKADKRGAIYGMLISLFIAGAAVFGVAVDLATSWGDHGPMALNLFAFVEDEGEFLMILLTFALCVGIYDVETRRSKAMADHGHRAQFLQA
jgi:hypothetical protein